MTNSPEKSYQNRWQVAPAVPAHLRQQLSHFHPVMLQVLYNRGLTDEGHIQAFLDGLYLEAVDPFLLKDMDKAVERINRAVERDENIVVYGDFDADGVTSTVLLVETLRGLGLSREKAQPYIPNRVDEGYGLNKEALSQLRAKGADLVITVDCGIRSLAEVIHANEIGLDMIVTDHHSLGAGLPPAGAVINPKRPDSAYPEKMLAGVGIAYKLAQALGQTLPGRANFNETNLLDLVAIGTVADLAPLLGENRRLVIEGLTVLNRSHRPGIAALAKISGLRAGSITAEGIGFGLGPRLNAAGRLAHAYQAARLLSVNNSLEAEKYANELNELNQKRRNTTNELSEKAERLITDPTAPILIAADSHFLSGVVGLVASRLSEKYYRPAIVIEKGESESRASCRSITEFHITEALDQLGHLLMRHGGHAQAAGFTIRNENLETFCQAITQLAGEKLSGLNLLPTLTIDAEIKLSEVDWALHGLLARLEPTGYANTPPVFMSRGVQVLGHRVMGQDNSHLRLDLSDGRMGYAAVAFGQADWASRMPRRIDLVYTINVNEWNGRRTLQLMVQDMQPTALL